MTTTYGSPAHAGDRPAYFADVCKQLGVSPAHAGIDRKPAKKTIRTLRFPPPTRG